MISSAPVILTMSATSIVLWPPSLSQTPIFHATSMAAVMLTWNPRGHTSVAGSSKETTSLLASANRRRRAEAASTAVFEACRSVYQGRMDAANKGRHFCLCHDEWGDGHFTILARKESRVC